MVKDSSAHRKAILTFKKKEEGTILKTAQGVSVDSKHP
jgi:hypothetical protein